MLNFVTRLAANYLYKRGLLADEGGWLVRHFGGRPVSSGVAVNETTAMQSTAVFASVRLIAGTIASLPLPVYRRDGDTKERDSDNPVYKLLHDRPNPDLSSFQWRQTGVAHQLLYGNWYNEIEFRRGKPWALHPIPPWRVKVLTKNRGKYYDIEIPNGENYILPASKILHVPNITVTGAVGISCIQAGAEAVGLSLAAEEYGAKFFGEGTNVGAVVEHPGKIAPDRRADFAENMRVQYAGLKKSHKLMLLEEGMKFARIGVPPNEAQFIETRKYQVAEIGRLFGITQLHKIGDLERATFSNVEHLGIEFVTDTIRPLLVNIEQEFNYRLFEDDAFCEFLVDGLLRGDTATRYAAYATARQWGWMSANDVRRLENMNPLPDEQGDVYYIPMNMIPADKIESYEPKTTVEPEPVDDDRSIESRSLEQRQRAADIRQTVANSYDGMFRNTVQKILTREKGHVIKAAKKHFEERTSLTFDDWLVDFYEEFRLFIKKELKPAIHAISGAVATVAAEEVNSKYDDVGIDKFVDDLSDRCSTRHIIASRSKIRKIVGNALSDGVDPVPLIEQQMEHWEENRADSYVSNGLVNTANEAAKWVFAGAGVQMLRWVARGSKTCPYCQELNGKIVGIDQPFVAKDDTLQSEDGRMRISKPTLSPPLHDGCVCSVIPE